MKMKPSPMIKDYIAMKREEGIKEGVKKGKVDGIKEVAKRMLQKKMEIENIIECTGLSKEKIMLLQKELEDQV
jgi:predicted transposase/invertase (TIGR01784 family)